MNAAELTKSLGGRWCGSYGMARCPAHDDRSPSLAIRDGKGKVLFHCHAGCEQAAVMAALKARGLWGGKSDPSVANPDDGQLLSPTRHDEARERTEAARSIWRGCEPATPDSFAARYFAARGIAFPVPPSIRTHGALRHCPSATFLPAMVSGVQNGQGKLAAIHRTYINLDGTGKANVRSPKLALGPLDDGAVRLARAGEVLGLAEGVETGMSAMQLFNIPVWCALGSRLHAVALPDHVHEVRVYADNGEAGHETARKAVDAFTKQGRRVLVQFPPPDFGDFNDILMNRRAA